MYFKNVFHATLDAHNTHTCAHMSTSKLRARPFVCPPVSPIAPVVIAANELGPGCAYANHEHTNAHTHTQKS